MNLHQIVESPRFERLVVAAILLNAITLGMETIDWGSEQVIPLLFAVDRVFLVFFTLEVGARFAAHRSRFFHDPWRIFDLIIVGVSWLPTAGAFSVLRALRVLRVLRMISVLPALRKVVAGLLSAIPGLGAVAAILVLIFYVGSVMATKIFGAAFPEWFGSIGKSAYTLFQVMTLESRSMGIVRPVMEEFPYAWLFFLPFILITTFTMLNLFIAVIVNAMHAETDEAAAERAQSGSEERNEMLEELRAIRARLDEMDRNVHRTEAQLFP